MTCRIARLLVLDPVLMGNIGFDDALELLDLLEQAVNDLLRFLVLVSIGQPSEVFVGLDVLELHPVEGPERSRIALLVDQLLTLG